LIAAVEDGQAAVVLGGRAPIISITAAKEFLGGGGSASALRSFLSQTGGRIGLAAEGPTVVRLQQQATALGRVLHGRDARIAAIAVRESVSLVTNDVRFFKFLRAIGFPVEGF